MSDLGLSGGERWTKAGMMGGAKGNKEGLRSSDVKAWIEKHHPDIKVISVPATLSRQMENGFLVRDDLGRYKLS